MLKSLLTLVMAFAVNSAYAQTDSVKLIQSIFKSESEELNTDMDEIDISLAAASAIRALGIKGYLIGIETEDRFRTIQFRELEHRAFAVPGAITIIAEDATGLKASVRLYLNATDQGHPVSESANVYVFIYAIKSKETIRVQKVEVDFKGLS